jgi:hypothetical protein
VEDVTDWYGLVTGGGPCAACGLDASTVALPDLAPSILREARLWDDLLDELAADDGALRRRGEDGTWAAIEYACHIAGVFAVYAERVQRVRTEDDPELGWWDHEAAADAEDYLERAVDAAKAGIADGAVALAVGLPRVEDPASWSRAGTRRGTERFTVEGIARFALHESVHHRLDAERSAAP